MSALGYVALFGKNITNTRAPDFVYPNFFGTLHGRLPNQPFRAGVELSWSLAR